MMIALVNTASADGVVFSAEDTKSIIAGAKQDTISSSTKSVDTKPKQGITLVSHDTKDTKQEAVVLFSPLQQAVLDNNYPLFQEIAPILMLSKIDTQEKFIKLSQAYNIKMKIKSIPIAQDIKKPTIITKSTVARGRSMEAQDTGSMI